MRPRWHRIAAGWEERITYDVDLDTLKGFGTILTQEAEAARLPRAYELDEQLDAVWRVLSGAAPRAAVLVGESGVGKTALINELAHRLRARADGPWHLLRISPAEFLAGTVYLGEWETKVQKLVAAVHHPRRVVLYVPNLEELAMMGMTSKSDANVANALAPHIERGDITILGESTVEAFRKGLGANRSLRRLFHAVQLPAANAEETRAILQAVALDAGVALDEGLLDRLTDLADFYSGGTAQPGRSVGLLRRVLSAGDRTGPLTERDVLRTISTSTGIPIDFLDDATPLDRAKTRAFFEARVMGQREAVDAVVDLVTLVKAGVTDPHKPFGVLLFVGPTGVGKTEMARSVAELLFGDPNRMVRLDMSEYATYEAYERLLGVGSSPGILTAAVRERPFCVLLLDEIEKSNLNVYDLCLQMFDAGRLTDNQGRTVDFRRTIIILTSNVGAQEAQKKRVGFGEQGAAPQEDVTMRELGRVFRPEFLNRIDRIVTFRPLAPETAEQIARRELGKVVERSGIIRRRLVVDVDESVVPLLLREGYSPAYGARPLKRTIERLVLLPVARAIASGEAVAGSLLRLVARRNRIEVEVAGPEPEPGREIVVAPRAAPVAERLAALEYRMATLREAAAPLSNRKSELLARQAAADWQGLSGIARATIRDEVWRLEGVLDAVDTLAGELRRLTDAADRARDSDRELARIDERLDALESNAAHVTFLVGSRDPRALGDAYVTLTLVRATGAALDGVATLARMYQALTRRHRLDVEILDDRRGGHPIEDVICLLVSGAGAYVLLAGEAGLHTVSRSHGKGHHGDREVIRVEVLPVPAEDVPAEAVHAEVRILEKAKGRLMQKPRLEVVLRHEPTLLTLRAWSDRARAEAVARLRPLLAARVAAGQPDGSLGRTPLVRRYQFGPAKLVKDSRTGRSTGRLEHVLEGNLEMFLTLPAAPEASPAG
jgi:ATP-dependent Clp protease ATP-binding subunit ClpC